MAILLATLVAGGTILGVVYGLPRLGVMIAGGPALAVLALATLALPFFALLGVAAGLRYRADRQALNRVGLWGSLLVALGILTMFGLSLWQTHQERQAIERVLGPVRYRY